MACFLVVLCISLMATVCVSSKFTFDDKLSDLLQKKGAESQAVGNLLQNLLAVSGKGKLDATDIEGVLRHFDSAAVPRDNKACVCRKDNCGCCAYLKWKIINLHDTLCTNVSYIPADYGISLTVTLGKHVIINETVSARNPPPLCVDIPKLKDLASICIVFHDLDVTKTTFKGCIAVQARLAKVIKEDFQLGCFTIPIKEGSNLKPVGEAGDYMDKGSKGTKVDQALRFKPFKDRGNL